MKKGFPKTFLGIAIGWENLGKMKGRPMIHNGEYATETQACRVCNRTVYVGKQEDIVFKYCPRCLIVTSVN